MTVKRTLRLIAILLLLVLLVGYLVFAVIYLRDGNAEEMCASVSITIDAPADERFLTSEDVVLLLSEANLYPEGKRMQEVHTADIEERLEQEPLIRRAICYKAANPQQVNEGTLCLDLQLRQPVLHVFPNKGDSYFVDDEGTLIPSVPRTHNLLTATGDITPDYAATELAPFALYVSENPYWRRQIVQAHVETDRQGRSRVKLIPREGEQVILLGPLDGYEKKLRRMRVFYEQGIPEVGWNKYSAFNLEFDNQIVCAKKK